MQEPNLAESLQRLANRECSGIYAISLRIMLTARLTDRWRALLLYDVERLVSAFNFETSGWGYRLDDPALRRDNSTTQFAALALRDAAARGVAIPRELWLRVEARFLNTQLADGSWDYAGEGKPRASMTAAAIATLAIVRRTCHRKAYDKGANDRVMPLERSIAAGLAWLDAHFVPQRNHGHSGHLAYYLFAIERACHATGRQRLGEYRWFRAGAEAIFARTLTRTSSHSVNEPTWRARAGSGPAMPQLALSMLFLSRGLRGDALVYFEGNAALQRPLAAEAMTESLARRLETRLGWMATNEPNAIDVDTPPALVADLHAHPDGLTSPDTPLARALVRTARGGGLVILSCDAGAGGLRRASEAVLRLLPHTRAIVVGHEHSLRREPFPIRKAPSAIEITNGIRTLAVLVGQDCARDFQRGIDEDDDAGGFLANVIMRAHGGMTPQPRTTTSSNGVAHASSGPGIAHCTADNQSHCEPAALQVCHKRLGGFTPRTCALNELTIDEAPTLVFLSGTEPWEPSEKAWHTIESLLAAGTTIIVETTGGQSAFATEFRAHAELHFATKATNSHRPAFQRRQLDASRHRSLRRRHDKPPLATHCNAARGNFHSRKLRPHPRPPRSRCTKRRWLAH